MRSPRVELDLEVPEPGHDVDGQDPVPAEVATERPVALDAEAGRAHDDDRAPQDAQAGDARQGADQEQQAPPQVDAAGDHPGDEDQQTEQEHRRPQEPAERRDPQAETGTSHPTSVPQAVGPRASAPVHPAAGRRGVGIGRARCPVTLGTRDHPTALPPRPRRAGGAGRRAPSPWWPAAATRGRGLDHLDHDHRGRGLSLHGVQQPRRHRHRRRGQALRHHVAGRPGPRLALGRGARRHHLPRPARLGVPRRPDPAGPVDDHDHGPSPTGDHHHVVHRAHDTTTTEPTPTTEGPTTTTTAPGPLVQIVSYAGRSGGRPRSPCATSASAPPSTGGGTQTRRVHRGGRARRAPRPIPEPTEPG